MTFNYSYTKKEKSETWLWSVLGDNGGVHIHIHRHSSDPTDYYGGIELHSKIPLHKGQDAHKDCWLLGGDCYGDGSSLYCHEYLIPVFRRAREADYKTLFNGELLNWYNNRLKEKKDETTISA